MTSLLITALAVSTVRVQLFTSVQNVTCVHGPCWQKLLSCQHGPCSGHGARYRLPVFTGGQKTPV